MESGRRKAVRRRRVAPPHRQQPCVCPPEGVGRPGSGGPWAAWWGARRVVVGWRERPPTREAAQPGGGPGPACGAPGAGYAPPAGAGRPPGGGPGAVGCRPAPPAPSSGRPAPVGAPAARSSAAVVWRTGRGARDRSEARTRARAGPGRGRRRVALATTARPLWGRASGGASARLGAAGGGRVRGAPGHGCPAWRAPAPCQGPRSTPGPPVHARPRTWPSRASSWVGAASGARLRIRRPPRRGRVAGALLPGPARAPTAPRGLAGVWERVGISA